MCWRCTQWWHHQLRWLHLNGAPRPQDRWLHPRRWHRWPLDLLLCPWNLCHRLHYRRQSLRLRHHWILSLVRWDLRSARGEWLQQVHPNRCPCESHHAGELAGFHHSQWWEAQGVAPQSDLCLYHARQPPISHANHGRDLDVFREVLTVTITIYKHSLTQLLVYHQDQH